jgi:hypothetical protein
LKAVSGGYCRSIGLLGVKSDKPSTEARAQY